MNSQNKINLFQFFFPKTGESGVFVGLLNSSVHVFMYTYYLISALGPQYRKYLWWKKYITWIQLIQFFAVVIYMTSMVLFSCTVDKFFTWFFLINAFIFIYLFADFYRKAYILNEKNKERKRLSIANAKLVLETNGHVNVEEKLKSS